MQSVAARSSADRVTTFDEVVLYVAIAIALAVPPFVAGLDGGSLQLGAAGAALVVTGVIFSWRLRDWGWRGLLAGAPLGIAAAAAFNLLLERELSMDESSLTMAAAELGLMFALRMVLLPIALSFVLVKYDIMAFSLVPALATFGLVGGQGNEIVTGVCFALFLPASLIAMGHGMLLSGMINVGGRSDSRWRLGRWRLRHWTALIAAVAAVAGVAFLLFFPISYYANEYRWQLLTRVAVGYAPARGAGPMRGGRGGISEVLPVGTGPISPSPEPMLTLWGQPDPLWRGQVFDHYTGRAWIRSEAVEAEETAPAADQIPPPALVAPQGPVLDISAAFPPRPGLSPQTHVVRIESGANMIFYSPGQIHRLVSGALAGSLRVDAYGCVEAPGKQWHRGTFYRVVSTPLDLGGRSSRPLPAAASLPRTYLYVPFGARRVADLARQVAGNEPTPPRRLMALIAYLQHNYQYTLDARPTPAGKDAADYFLFTSKRGYCDLFATSLALMARAVGIPTRVVDGYAYGSSPESDGAGAARAAVLDRPPGNPGGALVPVIQMRASDAHAWVEAYIEPWGWVSQDATPVGEDEPIPPLRHSMLHLGFFIQDHPFAAVFLTAVVLMTTIALVLKAKGRAAQAPRFLSNLTDERSAVMRAYWQLLLLLHRRGHLRRPSQTPHEFLVSLQQSGRSAAASHVEPSLPANGKRHSREQRSRLALADALPAITSLTELFVAVRYSPAPVSRETVTLASQRLAEARRLLRRS